MGDTGVFRRSRTEARAFYALATGLCVSGVLGRLWPVAALLGLVVFAAVVVGVAVLLRARRRARRAEQFWFGASRAAGPVAPQHRLDNGRPAASMGDSTVRGGAGVSRSAA